MAAGVKIVRLARHDHHQWPGWRWGMVPVGGGVVVCRRGSAGTVRRVGRSATPWDFTTAFATLDP